MERVICIFLLITLSFSSFGFSISKPKVLQDNNDLLVMVFIDNPPKELIGIVKRNLDVKFIVEIKLIRRDFGILNIQTEITNIVNIYNLSYDFVTERYILYNQYFFKSTEKFSNLFDTFYPLLIKLDLDLLKGNPDFEQIYEDTEFFVSVKAKVDYINMKPPLNIITSLIGLGGYETQIEISDTFKIR